MITTAPCRCRTTRTQPRSRSIRSCWHSTGDMAIAIESVPMLPASTSTARLPHLFIC
jgi:hypothetical protein